MAAALGIRHRRAALGGAVFVVRLLYAPRRASAARCGGAALGPILPRCSARGTLRNASADQLAIEGFTGERVAAAPLGGLALSQAVCTNSIYRCRTAIDSSAVAYLEEAFGAEHERTYGHRAGRKSRSSWSRWVVARAAEGESVPERVRSSRPAAAAAAAAYFGMIGWLETPVVRRSDLSKSRAGLSSSRNTTRRV
jgi:N-methylhydantoinase A